MRVSIKQITPADRNWVLSIVRQWGADFVVTRSRKVYPQDIPGFCAVDESGRKVGLVTYEIIDDQCEAVTLDALNRFTGTGTALMDRVREAAIAAGCRRLWLITTNDNLDAIRFYQKRGFTIAAVHANAIAQSRRMKPSIPVTGQFGIPIRDEIEFEMLL